MSKGKGRMSYLGVGDQAEIEGKTTVRTCIKNRLPNWPTWRSQNKVSENVREREAVKLSLKW